MFERFSKDARAAVIAAQDQARGLNSPVIDVEHILLGVLASADHPLAILLEQHGLTLDAATSALSAGIDQPGSEPFGEEDAEALRSIGIDLDAVRRSLAETFGEDAVERPTADSDEPRGFLARLRGNHIPFTPGAKKTLELALREAIARKDDRIATEHLLLGILRAPSAVARGLVEAHIPIGDLRAKVLDLLDRAA
ncbi:Clp protease N-terminal domain-containing protein [Aldersonia kunmingensis]|uniref:Clp protease N-terminal domain-containing protein n=1 Tax=Aldersonia kunmingensis TaxID=408066 RepID=UPI000831A96C|nr:Clp protease N-terminal domain-containing protein [Aldersonia kunmingensis]